MPQSAQLKLETPSPRAIPTIPNYPASPLRAGRVDRPQRGRRLPGRLLNFVPWDHPSIERARGQESPSAGHERGLEANASCSIRPKVLRQRPIANLVHPPAGQAARIDAELKKAKTRNQALEKMVSQLNGREKRLKSRLEEKGELLKDAKGELQEARTQVVLAEEKIDTLEALSQRLSDELVQYRGWWLTEYHSMKVVLGLLPDPDYVHDIAMASKARFDVYTASSK